MSTASPASGEHHGDVLANDPVPDGTVVTEVNGVAVNSSGTTDIQENTAR